MGEYATKSAFDLSLAADSKNNSNKVKEFEIKDLIQKHPENVNEPRLYNQQSQNQIRSHLE